MLSKSSELQGLLNSALRFLPARQLLDICHPALEVHVLVERQTLPFVQVHRRCNGNVGDCHGVAGKPFGLRQPGIKNAGKPVPVAPPFR